MRNAHDVRIISLLLFTIFTLFCPGCSKQETSSYSGPPVKMVIGTPRNEASVVQLAADYLGYFKKMGIDAELLECDSGVAAMAALNDGRADLALSSDFVFASNIDKHPDLRIITATNSIKNTFMIALKDRGIQKPADLKGKRIAVTLTGIGEYYLGKFLNSNRLRLEDVILVNMTPAMMEKEIVSGTIDAAITWDPVARRMKDSLGAKAYVWPAQAESPYHMVLISRDSFIKKEPAALVRMQKALMMAEKTIEEDPASIQQYISKRIGMPEKYLADIWSNYQFKIFLDRTLLLTLEDESRWIRKSQGTPDLKLPNYLNYLYLDALKAARPESVTIIN